MSLMGRKRRCWGWKTDPIMEAAGEILTAIFLWRNLIDPLKRRKWKNELYIENNWIRRKVTVSSPRNTVKGYEQAWLILAQYPAHLKRNGSIRAPNGTCSFVLRQRMPTFLFTAIFPQPSFLKLTPAPHAYLMSTHLKVKPHLIRIVAAYHASPPAMDRLQYLYLSFQKQEAQENVR